MQAGKQGNSFARRPANVERRINQHLAAIGSQNQSAT
jgi:hypothetical protein